MSIYNELKMAYNELKEYYFIWLIVSFLFSFIIYFFFGSIHTTDVDKYISTANGESFRGQLGHALLIKLFIFLHLPEFFWHIIIILLFSFAIFFVYLIFINLDFNKKSSKIISIIYAFNLFLLYYSQHILPEYALFLFGPVFIYLCIYFWNKSNYYQIILGLFSLFIMVKYNFFFFSIIYFIYLIYKKDKIKLLYYVFGGVLSIILYFSIIYLYTGNIFSDVSSIYSINKGYDTNFFLTLFIPFFGIILPFFYFLYFGIKQLYISNKYLLFVLLIFCFIQHLIFAGHDNIFNTTRWNLVTYFIYFYISAYGIAKTNITKYWLYGYIFINILGFIILMILWLIRYGKIVF